MKNSVELLIDKTHLKNHMALTGHTSAKEFVSEAIALYTSIAEELLVSGRVPGFIDETTNQGTTYDADGLLRIEAAREEKPQTGPAKGRNLSPDGISTRVQVGLEEEEQCSYVRSRTGHANYNDFASEAVGLYMDMIDSVLQGKLPAAIDAAKSSYIAYSTPGLYHAALEISGNRRRLGVQADAATSPNGPA